MHRKATRPSSLMPSNGITRIAENRALHILRVLLFVSLAAYATCGTGRAQSTTVLNSGQILAGQTGLGDSERFYSIQVPASQTRLTFQTGATVGGTGDVDIFVRRGSPPTTTLNDARSTTPGTTSESITISNPAAGTYYLMLKGRGVGYIAVSILVSFEPSGAAPLFQWVRISSGSDSGFTVRRGEAVACDASGNSYVTGTLFGGVSFAGVPMPGSSQGFLLKYDREGQLVWLNSVPGATRSHGVTVATDGNIYVTGESSGNTFVSKFNGNGFVSWTRSFPGTGVDAGLGIAWDSSRGTVVVAGYQTQPVARAPAGARVARYLIVDADGTLLHQSVIPGDNLSYFKSVTVHNGIIHLVGAFNGTWDSITSGKAPDGTPSADAMLMSLKILGTITQGNPIVILPSSLAIGGTGASDDYASSIAVTTDGAVYVAGSFGGDTHFVARIVNNAREWTRTTFGYSANAYYSYSTSADYNVSVAADHRGGVYWAGRFDGNFVGGDSYLMNVDSSGTARWSPISADCRTYGMAVAPDRAVYLVGSTAGFAVFGNQTTNTNTTQVFTAALRSAALFDSSSLTNLSIRSLAGTGAQTLIVGFAVGGAGTKPVLIRGIGPSLGLFNLQGALADPVLKLFSASGDLLQENNDWGGASVLANAFAGVGAFPLASASKDSALIQNAVPASYTAHITSSTGSGIALVEAYDTQQSSSGSRFINLSARTQVETGENILVAGFVITGSAAKRLLIRGIGPSLALFAIPGALSDARMRLFNSDGQVVQENDDWGGSPALSGIFSAVGAFPLAANSKDSAMAVILEPGAYTVHVSGVNNATGVGLVEIYEIP